MSAEHTPVHGRGFSPHGGGFAEIIVGETTTSPGTVGKEGSAQWPVGCRDPDSCARHRVCMYLGCVHKSNRAIGQQIGTAVLNKKGQ